MAFLYLQDVKNYEYYVCKLLKFMHLTMQLQGNFLGRKDFNILYVGNNYFCEKKYTVDL